MKRSVEGKGVTRQCVPVRIYY